MLEVRETLDGDLQTLNQYKESFDCIKEVAELDDIDAIIAKFLQQEAENFALFNYVTELNGEIERRQEEVNDVQQNIDTMRENHQQTIAASEHELELLMVSSTTLRYRSFITLGSWHKTPGDTTYELRAATSTQYSILSTIRVINYSSGISLLFLLPVIARSRFCEVAI